MGGKGDIEVEKKMGDVVWFETIKFPGGFSVTTSDSCDVSLLKWLNRL